jgi:uncharacterized radical SAM superfamily Fe-S cluster-containing enzyme
MTIFPNENLYKLDIENLYLRPTDLRNRRVGFGNLRTENIIKNTTSFCPMCFGKVPTKIIERDNKIFIRRKCSKDGIHEILLENDANFYKDINKYREKNKQYLEHAFIPLEKIKEIQDSFSSINIYITSKCNLRCPICFSAGKEEEVSFEDIDKTVSKIKGKFITITGGEPTLRKDLPKIINRIVNSKNVPILQTNGLKFLNIAYGRKLRKSGLRYVHLSFDGFNEELYEKVYGDRKLLKLKLKALENMKKLGFKVILSMAITKGFEEEIFKTIQLASRNYFIIDIFIRPVEPLGNASESRFDMLTQSDILKMIEKKTNGKLRMDDFIEFYKFRWNLYKCISKLFKKIKYRFYPEVPLTLVLNRNITPLFKYKDLEKINEELQNVIQEKNIIKSYLKFLKTVFHLFNFIANNPYLLYVIFKDKFKISSIGVDIWNHNNLFRITVDKVFSLFNYDPDTNIRTYTLEKGENGISFAVKY